MDLSYNKLQSFEDDEFEWNPLKLKKLNLAHNLFEAIPHFLFFDLQNIEGKGNTYFYFQINKNCENDCFKF